MRIINEDQQDKIDAAQSTLDDLNDQLRAARDEGDNEKVGSLQDRIDSMQDKLDRLENPEKKESHMRIIDERGSMRR